MKHPHDAIDQMDLDLAMSGVFRAVPLLPDSEKLGRIQVFTDGSAMLERAWPHRRTSAAWGAVLVQTNSQGLDALIGFLGDTVQTHQQHPQYLGARVKTISTAELLAIITTLATVLRACSKPPELDLLSDSVFSIKVLQRHRRTSSNVELIQCGRALVDHTRRITQVTFQHVKAHSGLLFNEMADRVTDAARKRIRIGATAPCLRPSVAGQGQEQKQDHHPTHSISSEQVCFWLDIARCTDPKGVSCTRNSDKSSSVEIIFATANVLSLGENLVTRRRDPGLQISGRGAELDRIFHSTGLQVIGLQECRAKKARRLEGDNFYMISEPADARGRGGCELWVAKELKPNKRNVRLLHSEPELLLASLELPKCRCFVLIFHAPPECAGEQERLLWWQRCKSVVQESAVDTEVLVTMCDANARVGSVQSSWIGPMRPEKENQNGRQLHQMLQEFDQIASNTFFLQGGSSWTSSTGAQARIDYVAIPRQWASSLVVAGTHGEIVLVSGDFTDHKVVYAKVRMRAPGARTDLLRKPRVCWAVVEGGCVIEQFRDELAKAPEITKWVALDTHAELLAKWLRIKSAEFFSIPARRPRKPWITKRTFALIAQKQPMLRELSVIKGEL